ncbi:hypothetical protein OM076_10045 [Solirubrobacter ginsenosidimutans]|uniref:Uncharacterized protein n=1 Tax=Solirubrobacter ginsenosidimutans TaxID=490573 RepID=A0A9X3RZ70_9ACTN|nr:hypothetical protein [Solirubrobacter ginsenosidimutans]MDA0160605.1 hypothetical protein [Solirubrobacter ginsenosidimutans]
MLRPPDVFVLLGLLTPARGGGWSVQELAGDLAMPQAELQRSLTRLGESPVFDKRSEKVIRPAAQQLLLNAVALVAPARLGAPARGMPTAWAAPPLSARTPASNKLPPVWPDPLGGARGLSVTPLHKAASEVSLSDPWMHEALALVDALRLGDARIRRQAADLLRPRLT